MESGEFRFICHGCGKEVKIEIINLQKGRFRIEPVERASSSKKKKSKSRSRVILEDEENWDERPEERNYSRRFLIMTAAMVLVGILGFASSISTLAGTFGIKDLEEQTPQEFASLSIWVIDSSTGEGIEDVEIRIDSKDGNLTTETDSNGLGTFSKVMSGQVSVELYKPGYKRVEGSLIVRKGVPNVQDVPMEKGPESQRIPMKIGQFETEEYSSFITDLMAVVMMLSAIMAFVAAYSIHKREFFSLAVLTSFLSLFSFGFFMGSFISFFILIAVIFSYEGFYHTYLLRWFLQNRGREDLKRFFGSERSGPPRLPPSGND